MSGARLQKTILAVVLLAVLSCGASSASACSTSSHCYALATKTVSSPSGFRGVSADLSATCLDVPSPTTYFVTNEVWIADTSDWVEAGLAHGVPNGDRKYFFWARQYNGVYYESSPLPGGDPALATYYTATITSANQSRLWNVTIHGNTSTPHGPTYPAIRLDTGTETTHEENVDRAVLAVRMVVDRGGHKIAHRFTRGLIRSVAALSYEEVQAAQDGLPDDRTSPLLADGIAPLYQAYAALKSARALRQPLDLDLPERRIELAHDGRVRSVAFKERLDAHRLIEEMMILANVAAAEELIRLRKPLLYRVHEEPSLEKIDALRETAEASGFTLAKGQVLKTATLNRLLEQSQGTEFDELMNVTMLRSMTQAYYHPQNFGHFGLALKNYAHFTSPIRRYSDLIVHRALIAGHGWGKDGLSAQDVETLDETAQLISDSERRSMAAERDTADRYLAAYLSDRVGAEFAGRISGVAKFGLFVKLDETGADGLIPIRTLGREYFHHDADSHTLMGADSGRVIRLGQRVLVRLAEAVAVTGGLTLDLLEIEGETMASGPSGVKRGRRLPHKPGPAKVKAAKAARKVERKRR